MLDNGIARGAVRCSAEREEEAHQNGTPKQYLDDVHHRCTDVRRALELLNEVPKYERFST